VIHLKSLAVSSVSLFLLAPPGMPAGQGARPPVPTPMSQPIPGTATASSMDMDTVVIRAKRSAPPLPDWLKQELNAPLMPTPTATERKIAPVVRTARNLWILGAFIAIFAGGIAKAK